jgi:nitrogen fixation NifU-like protein
MMDELRELYQEIILEHGKNPRNHRHPEDANREAKGNNPLCGDRLTVYLTIGPDDVIRDAAFEGRGCAISTASASMMTEILKGKTVGEAEHLFESFHGMLTRDDWDLAGQSDADQADFERLQVLAGVKQFPMRVKCATLAWHTMHAAIEGATKVTTE